MIRRLLLGALLLLVCVLPVSAQFFSVVYDPTNYANAVLRYGQLQAQLSQLITTYNQIRTQYLLLRTQAERLPFALTPRYQSVRTPWRPLTSCCSNEFPFGTRSVAPVVVLVPSTGTPSYVPYASR